MSTAKPIRDRNVSQVIAEAIDHEMAADERIVVLGQDVGAMGGVYGATRNLQRKYGDRRVRDTPIAETALTGMAVGLAMAGYRPLIEIMFADFLGVCLEHITNGLAKNRYMSGGAVSMPAVVKTAAGCEGSAAQHSQCYWGTMAHFPGIRIVVPSNPHDSKGMMSAALLSDDPVVFMEHKLLLLRKASQFRHGNAVPQDRYQVALEGARVVRNGSDVTVASLSAGVEDSLTAAADVASEGIDVEVIDLRSVVPLDTATVAESVAKTRSLIVVDEDYRSFGLSGELVAQVVEELGPNAIDGISRHANPDLPVPAAVSLERVVLPNAKSIARVIKETLA